MDDVKQRLGQLEIGLADMSVRFAHIDQQMASILDRTDRVEARLDRIERRLDLVEGLAHAPGQCVRPHCCREHVKMSGFGSTSNVRF